MQLLFGEDQAKMKVLGNIILVCLVFSTYASREIIGILDDAKDLTDEEIKALRPLFDAIQTQYDYILSEGTQDGDSLDPTFKALYTTTREDFDQYFADLLQRPVPSTAYDTSLPTVAELIGMPSTDMTQEEINEWLDMESILQEVLDEAQLSINEIVQQALLRQAEVLKLDKHKVVEYIYNALSNLFYASTRVSRAAYCTYSQIPPLNASLHDIYDGVDCYTFTTQLILRIQNETVATIKAIKQNIYDLADIYKQVAAKKTIMGKILAILLNVTKIMKDIRNIYNVSMQAKDNIENKLPTAANETIECATDFAQKLPQIIETVSNLTTCILYVDDTTKDYHYFDSDEEYDFDLNDTDFIGDA